MLRSAPSSRRRNNPSRQAEKEGQQGSSNNRHRNGNIFRQHQQMQEQQQEKGEGVSKKVAVATKKKKRIIFGLVKKISKKVNGKATNKGVNKNHPGKIIGSVDKPTTSHAPLNRGGHYRSVGSSSYDEFGALSRLASQVYPPFMSTTTRTLAVSVLHEEDSLDYGHPDGIILPVQNNNVEVVVSSHEAGNESLIVTSEEDNNNVVINQWVDFDSHSPSHSIAMSSITRTPTTPPSYSETLWPHSPNFDSNLSPPTEKVQPKSLWPHSPKSNQTETEKVQPTSLWPHSPTSDPKPTTNLQRTSRSDYRGPVDLDVTILSDSPSEDDDDPEEEGPVDIEKEPHSATQSLAPTVNAVLDSADVLLEDLLSDDPIDGVEEEGDVYDDATNPEHEDDCSGMGEEDSVFKFSDCILDDIYPGLEGSAQGVESAEDSSSQVDHTTTGTSTVEELHSVSESPCKDQEEGTDAFAPSFSDVSALESVNPQALKRSCGSFCESDATTAVQGNLLKSAFGSFCESEATTDVHANLQSKYAPVPDPDPTATIMEPVVELWPVSNLPNQEPVEEDNGFGQFLNCSFQEQGVEGLIELLGASLVQESMEEYLQSRPTPPSGAGPTATSAAPVVEFDSCDVHSEDANSFDPSFPDVVSNPANQEAEATFEPSPKVEEDSPPYELDTAPKQVVRSLLGHSSSTNPPPPPPPPPPPKERSKVSVALNAPSSPSNASCASTSTSSSKSRKKRVPILSSNNHAPALATSKTDSNIKNLSQKPRKSILDRFLSKTKATKKPSMQDEDESSSYLLEESIMDEETRSTTRSTTAAVGGHYEEIQTLSNALIGGKLLSNIGNVGTMESDVNGEPGDECNNIKRRTEMKELEHVIEMNGEATGDTKGSLLRNLRKESPTMQRKRLVKKYLGRASNLIHSAKHTSSKGNDARGTAKSSAILNQQTIHQPSMVDHDRATNLFHSAKSLFFRDRSQTWPSYESWTSPSKSECPAQSGILFTNESSKQSRDRAVTLPTFESWKSPTAADCPEQTEILFVKESSTQSQDSTNIPTSGADWQFDAWTSPTVENAKGQREISPANTTSGQNRLTTNLAPSSSNNQDHNSTNQSSGASPSYLIESVVSSAYEAWESPSKAEFNDGTETPSMKLARFLEKLGSIRTSLPNVSPLTDETEESSALRQKRLVVRQQQEYLQTMLKQARSKHESLTSPSYNNDAAVVSPEKCGSENFELLLSHDTPVIEEENTTPSDWRDLSINPSDEDSDIKSTASFPEKDGGDGNVTSSSGESEAQPVVLFPSPSKASGNVETGRSDSKSCRSEPSEDPSTASASMEFGRSDSRSWRSEPYEDPPGASYSIDPDWKEDADGYHGSEVANSGCGSDSTEATNPTSDVIGNDSFHSEYDSHQQTSSNYSIDKADTGSSELFFAAWPDSIEISVANDEPETTTVEAESHEFGAFEENSIGAPFGGSPTGLVSDWSKTTPSFTTPAEQQDRGDVLCDVENHAMGGENAMTNARDPRLKSEVHALDAIIPIASSALQEKSDPGSLDSRQSRENRIDDVCAAVSFVVGEDEFEIELGHHVVLGDSVTNDNNTSSSPNPKAHNISSTTCATEGSTLRSERLVFSPTVPESQDHSDISESYELEPQDSTGLAHQQHDATTDSDETYIRMGLLNNAVCNVNPSGKSPLKVPSFSENFQQSFPPAQSVSFASLRTSSTASHHNSSSGEDRTPSMSSFAPRLSSAAFTPDSPASVGDKPLKPAMRRERSSSSRGRKGDLSVSFNLMDSEGSNDDPASVLRQEDSFLNVPLLENTSWEDCFGNISAIEITPEQQSMIAENMAAANSSFTQMLEGIATKSATPDKRPEDNTSFTQMLEGIVTKSASSDEFLTENLNATNTSFTQILQGITTKSASTDECLGENANTANASFTQMLEDIKSNGCLVGENMNAANASFSQMLEGITAKSASTEGPGENMIVSNNSFTEMLQGIATKSASTDQSPGNNTRELSEKNSSASNLPLLGIKQCDEWTTMRNQEDKTAAFIMRQQELKNMIRPMQQPVVETVESEDSDDRTLESVEIEDAEKLLVVPLASKVASDQGLPATPATPVPNTATSNPATREASAPVASAAEDEFTLPDQTYFLDNALTDIMDMVHETFSPWNMPNPFRENTHSLPGNMPNPFRDTPPLPRFSSIGKKAVTKKPSEDGVDELSSVECTLENTGGGEAERNPSFVPAYPSSKDRRTLLL